MQPLKISYSYYAKYKDHLYCRVRQAGTKTFDVNLHTTDPVVAENYVKLRRSELDLYNRYVMAGEPVPEEVERKLLRRGSPAIGQKGTSGAVPLLTTALDAWEQELRRQGKRERTVESYCKQVRLTVPAGAVTTDINRKSVRTWLASHDNTKTSTRKSYSVALREFTKFCISEYGVDPTVVNDWPMVKVQQEEKGYWTMQQIAKIISCVKCQDPVVENCYKTWFWFLTVTGCRQGEAGLVEWRDIKDGVVTIRAENTKGNKTRRIPLDYRILDMVNKLPKTSKLVFANIAKGQAGRYAVLAKAIKRAGVPAGGLHTVRHSTSMLAYSRTEDLKGTAELLGHSPAVALVYYQASRQPDQLRGLVNKTFGDEILIPNAMDDLIENGLI